MNIGTLFLITGIMVIVFFVVVCSECFDNETPKKRKNAWATAMLATLIIFMLGWFLYLMSTHTVVTLDFGFNIETTHVEAPK